MQRICPAVLHVCGSGHGHRGARCRAPPPFGGFDSAEACRTAALGDLLLLPRHRTRAAPSTGTSGVSGRWPRPADWWYDTRSFDAYTVEELTEQLPIALIELTSEAMPQPHTPMAVGH